MVKQVLRENNRSLSVVITIILAIAGVCLIWWIYSASTVAHMKSIANQFTPGESWQLQYENSDPPTPFCIHDMPCPYYSKAWKLQQPFTKEEFIEKIHNAGWSSVVDGNCVPNPRFGGYGTVCSAEVDSDGFKINISYMADPQDQAKMGVEIMIQR